MNIKPVMWFGDGGAGDGGGSAPPPAPGGTASDGAPVSPIPDSPAEPSESHDSFAGMEDNDFDLVEIPPEPAEGGEPAAAEGEKAPAPAPPASATPAATPEPPKADAKQEPGSPAGNEPSAPRSPLDQAIEGFRTNHQQMSEWASKELFALSKEDAEILETDAASFIPVLMGRVYSQALQATTNLIKNFVPEMVNNGVASTNARTARATEALQEFYASNSDLNPQQHGALVDKWARAFRAANPSASRADAIKFVGNAVRAEVGAAPAARGNGAKPRPAPFAPARPGARAPTPSKPHDPYEGMDMEFDNE